jgi:hypothetical protein
MIAPGTSLVTIIPLPEDGYIPRTWLQIKIDNYHTSDDVFRDEFLAGIVFGSRVGRKFDLTHDVEALLQDWGTHWVGMLTQATADPSEPVGPHAVAKSSLWQVFRLCEDVNGTFLTTPLPLSGLGCVTDLFYILIFQVRIACSLDDRPFPKSMDS